MPLIAINYKLGCLSALGLVFNGTFLNKDKRHRQNGQLIQLSYQILENCYHQFVFLNISFISVLPILFFRNKSYKRSQFNSISDFPKPG